jgi:hypothetical protein
MAASIPGVCEFRAETGYPLEVRGGDVDESPFVYRKLDDVQALRHHLARDQPLASALAVALRLRAAHDPPGAVHRRAERPARELGVDALDHDGPVAHRAADEPGLTRECQVVRAHEETGTIKVAHRLLPVVVVMAGANIVDPFKD